jgi:hypothetical protein
MLFTSTQQAAVIGKLAGTKAALSEDSERPDRMAGEAWSGHPSETSFSIQSPVPSCRKMVASSARSQFQRNEVYSGLGGDQRLDVLIVVRGKGRWATFLRGFVSRLEGWGRHTRLRCHSFRSEERLAGCLKQIFCHGFSAFISVHLGESRATCSRLRIEGR